MRKILITGGAGFIGSHVTRFFVKNYPNYKIYNLDALKKVANLQNIKDLENKKNYKFIHGDITDEVFIDSIFDKYDFDSVINLAAETHVDISINNPILFAKTNILGTINLLNSFTKKCKKNNLFYHISTDEVYGSLNKSGFFSENSNYKPNSPYSASKASSNHFVRSFGKTYNIPYVISNSSNNYGPFQYPEKLIPLTIYNIIKNNSLDVYGDGKNIRDWLYVSDHIRAIDLIFHKGVKGETYNIGGLCEVENIKLVKMICKMMDKKLNLKNGSSEGLINFVEDRKGHDFRYAIDIKKIKTQLGWSPRVSLEKGLSETIDWYISKSNWLSNSKSNPNYFEN